MTGAIILDPMALWGVEMSEAEMWALIMAAHDMRKTLDAIKTEANEALWGVRGHHARLDPGHAIRRADVDAARGARS